MRPLIFGLLLAIGVGCAGGTISDYARWEEVFLASAPNAGSTTATTRLSLLTLSCTSLYTDDPRLREVRRLAWEGVAEFEATGKGDIVTGADYATSKVPEACVSDGGRDA